MAAPRRTETSLRVGRLVKAHGLKGALKLELYTDDPDRRFVPRAVFTLQVPESSPWRDRTLTLTELRYYNAQPVAFFEGVTDRTAAETLLRAILWVDLAGDEPDEDDAWYDHQLVGLDVVRDGAVVGSVARVDHFPAQDLLAVRTPAGEVLVPFVSAIVPSVDIEAGTVTVTPPDGLFEEPVDEDASADDAERPDDTGSLDDTEPADDASATAQDAASVSDEDADPAR